MEETGNAYRHWLVLGVDVGWRRPVMHTGTGWCWGVDVAGSGSCPVAAFDTAVMNCRCFAAIVLVTLSVVTVTLLQVRRQGDRGYVPTGAVRRDAPSLLFSSYRLLFPLVKPMTTHLHLVQRLSTRGAMPPLLYMPSWHGA